MTRSYKILEGFDHQKALELGDWSEDRPGFSYQTGRSGTGYSIGSTGGSTGSYTSAIFHKSLSFDKYNTWVYLGLAFNYSSSYSGTQFTNPYVYIFEAGGSYYVRLDSQAGLLTVYNPYGDSLVINDAWSMDQWIHIEVALYTDASSSVGQMKARINGVDAGSVTTDTGNSGNDATGLKLLGSSNTFGELGPCSFDDVFMYTSNTEDDWMGDVQILSLTPNGNGSFSDFVSNEETPDSVDNYLMVNTVADSSTYVESSVSGAKDSYTYEDLPVGTNPIAVGVQTYASKSDPGASAMRPIAYDGSNTWTGDSFGVSSGSFRDSISITDNAPDGSPWDLAKFNSCQFGVEIV